MLPKPPDGYQDKDEAEKLLKRYLLADRRIPVRLPRRVDPEQVDTHLEQFLRTDELDEGKFACVGRLMRFYDLRGRAEQVALRLQGGEEERERFLASLEAVAIVGDMGSEAHQVKAADYFRKLVGNQYAREEYRRLIRAFFHLPAAAQDLWIKTPMEAEMRELEPEIDANDDAATRYYELEAFLQDDLSDVLKARKVKAEIGTIKEFPRRLTRYGEYYLELEVSRVVDMQWWAVMMLQRECNAATPADLAGAFTRGLGTIMSRVEKTPLNSGDEADLKGYVTRCARGVQFYGGSLNAKQEEFVAKYSKPEQNDVLYWDPAGVKPSVPQGPAAETPAEPKSDVDQDVAGAGKED